MKRCPSCKAEYFEDRLEFCLEDGSRLERPGGAGNIDRPYAGETVPLRVSPPVPGAADSAETVVLAEPEPTAVKAAAIPSLSTEHGWVEMTGLGIALLHNWWQWIYLEKVYVHSIAEFLLSANFLMWLLLLAAGLAINIYALKRTGNKLLVAISLITLSINLLLFVIPRR
jgi:hypothetical protein